FLFACYFYHRDLLSFPTRRSSDLGDIRFAVQAWCGSRQVRLAVLRSGDPRVGIVQPLRLRACECPGKHNSDDRSNCPLIAHKRPSYLLPLGEAMLNNSMNE